jgi:parvulin-like peptidyl-prolyl isomerase
MLNKWLAGLVIGVFLASCSNGSSSSSDKLSGNATLLIVNGEEVSLEQFRAELNVYKKKFWVHNTEEILPEELTWLNNRVVEQIVHNTLLRQEIRNNEIEIDQEELDDALLQAQVGYPEDSFKKQLEFEGLSRKQWEYTIENNLLIKKLIHNLVNSKVSVDEEEMRRYFVANESTFHKREQVRALHIMVETEEEIRQIQKELQSKQKDFPALAQEYSLGPEGALGGDLGYFEAGQMPEEFDNVFKLKINGVSDIIRTPYGFHLLKVVDKIKEREMSFDESKKQVEQVLLQEVQGKAFQKWLVELKEKSVIEIKYDLLEKIN